MIPGGGGGGGGMDKSISYLANKTAETADMLKYPAIRLFHVGYPRRTAPREILQGIFLLLQGVP